MPKKDDPIELLQQNQNTDRPQQSREKQELASHVQNLFRSAWDAKQQLNLNEIWRMCDDYKHNRQNPKQSDEHPGSMTNIIHPIVESQIADLVDKPFSTSAKGWEPSDDMYAEQAQNIMDFVLYRNKFKQKVNVSEHDRLELGSTIIKVWFDDDELDGRGLPVFEPISPANFFPDPKVTAPHLLQKAEFVIHATPRPLSWFRRQFPEWGKYVRREVSVPYDPDATFEDAETDEVHVITSQKALLLECYMRDENGELFCVHVANNLVLEDSREKKRKVQRRNLYPFVVINCYNRRGTVWGMGDVELLIPTQDLINELDDQIRMNARLSGNPQIVVGMGAGKGFDFRKWTNKPGLRIPMRDQNAWSIVPPQPVSHDIPVRREKAFEEANIISGRPDVNRGEKPGQITAAAAIMALQQAGQKGVIHKSEMFKEGWSEVLELLFDEVLENWDEEMWIRIDGDQPDYQFVNPAQFRQVPIMIPNDVEGEDTIKPLMDIVIDEETGQVREVLMTRDAQFDFALYMGNGLPTDKAFVFQTLIDLTRVAFPDGPAITRKELRDFLREQVGINLDPDEDPQEVPQSMESMPPPQGVPAVPGPMMQPVQPQPVPNMPNLPMIEGVG